MSRERFREIEVYNGNLVYDSPYIRAIREANRSRVAALQDVDRARERKQYLSGFKVGLLPKRGR